MQVDLFETMSSMYKRYGLNVVPLWDIGQQIEEIDLGFRKKMAAHFDYQGVADALERTLAPGICYLFEDDLHLNYSLFRFPEEKAVEYHCRILSLGPFLTRPVIYNEFQTMMAQKKIDPHYLQDFLEFFNRIPCVPSFDSWNHVLGFFLERLCGTAPEFRKMDAHQNALSAFAQTDVDYSNPAQPDVALTLVESRYDLERRIMDSVAAGNFNDAYEAFCGFQHYRLLPRVADPVRNEKNLKFTFNTLLRKAAEAGHVHPLHIDSLSRQIAIQIESCLSLKQLDGMSITMIRKYCMLVHNYSRRPYSKLIQTTLDYIDFHYSGELSLSSLAQMCSVSESYLSALFKKETGTTVTDYVNNTRIRQSLILLNSTKLSIGEISARCGFLDANYFSRTFKKILGLSPREYRSSIRKQA